MVVKFFVAGFYGCRNLGDDAILLGLTGRLSQVFAGAQFFVTAREPEMLPPVQGISPVPHSIGKGMLPFLLAQLKGEWLNVIRKMIEVHAFVLGGGALLHDLTPFNIPMFLMMTMLARILGKRVAFLGVATARIKSPMSRALLRILVESADLVTVRDLRSLQALEALGVRKKVHLTADNALLIDLKQRERGHVKEVGESLTIGISVCAWFKSADFWAWRRGELELRPKKIQLAKLADRIIDSFDVDVLFVPLFHPYDRDASVEVRNMMSRRDRARVLETYEGPQRMLEVFRNLRLLVAMRLHSVVLAALAELPTVTIAYDPNVTSFLEDMRLLRYSTDIGDLDFETVFKIVNEVWSNSDSVTAEIREGIAQLKERAELNISLMQELLAGK